MEQISCTYRNPFLTKPVTNLFTSYIYTAGLNCYMFKLSIRKQVICLVPKLRKNYGALKTATHIGELVGNPGCELVAN